MNPACRLLRPPPPSQGDPGPGAAKLPGRRQKRRRGSDAAFSQADVCNAGSWRAQRQAPSASPWGNTLWRRPSCTADTHFLQTATCKSTFLAAGHMQKHISFSWQNAEAPSDPGSDPAAPSEVVVQDCSLRPVFSSTSFLSCLLLISVSLSPALQGCLCPTLSCLP